MPQKSGCTPHSLCKSLYFKGFLRHTAPHFMAYFGGIFFARVVEIVFRGGKKPEDCFPRRSPFL